MLEQFINLIRQWIDIAIYVLGSQGETITSADQIRRMENTTVNANRAIALWIKRGKRCVAFDCSGLVVWALLKLGLITSDMKADGIYDKCPKIAKAVLRLGDFAFRINEDGNAHHIGIVTRFVDGIPWITESKGRDDGVVERSINADPGYWEKYGSNIFINSASGGGGFDMVVLKFGETNLAVNDLQKSLIKAYGKLTGDDGTVYLSGQETNYYGTATKNGVLALLKEYGLPGDGKTFDELGSAALTFKLAGIKPSTGITQAMLDAEKAKAAALLVQVNDLGLVVSDLRREILEKADQIDEKEQELVALANNKRESDAILSLH